LTVHSFLSTGTRGAVLDLEMQSTPFPLPAATNFLKIVNSIINIDLVVATVYICVELAACQSL
jgi:hypothetical protein